MQTRRHCGVNVCDVITYDTLERARFHVQEVEVEGLEYVWGGYTGPKAGRRHAHPAISMI